MIQQSLVYKNQKWNTPPRLELDSDYTTLICFYDPQLDWSGLVQELRIKFPKSKIIGCSSSGEISGSHVNDQSFSVQITQFEKTKIKLVEIDVALGESSFVAGAKLGAQLKCSELSYVLVLSDGLCVNGTELSNGITSIVAKENSKVVVSGGLSGDGARFQRTNVFNGSKIKSQRVVALGFYGKNLIVGTGSVGGWDSFGPERIVTRSNGNILFELDGQPALSLYKQYLGQQAEQLPSSALFFPLAITTDLRKNIVRTVLAVDEKLKNMTFAGDIPEGATVQLMKANFTKLVAGAAKSAEMAATKMQMNQIETLAIAISCVGRRLVLGERIEDETEALKQVLPPNSQIIGFYSYGELSPTESAPCELHNQTMTITLLQESA